MGLIIQVPPGPPTHTSPLLYRAKYMINLCALIMCDCLARCRCDWLCSWSVQCLHNTSTLIKPKLSDEHISHYRTVSTEVTHETSDSHNVHRALLSSKPTGLCVIMTMNKHWLISFILKTTCMLHSQCMLFACVGVSIPLQYCMSSSTSYTLFGVTEMLDSM